MTTRRTSPYTPELDALICERLAAGESLRSISKLAGMVPESTVRSWVVDNKEGFSARYARARGIGLDVLAEELLAIADTPVEGLRSETSDAGVKLIREDMLGHRRLQIDTRKWFLSKMAPKKYGDRTAMELTGADGGPIEINDTERAAKIAAILASAQARKEFDGSDLV